MCVAPSYAPWLTARNTNFFSFILSFIGRHLADSIRLFADLSRFIRMSSTRNSPLFCSLATLQPWNIFSSKTLIKWYFSEIFIFLFTKIHLLFFAALPWILQPYSWFCSLTKSRLFSLRCIMVTMFTILFHNFKFYNVGNLFLNS